MKTYIFDIDGTICNSSGGDYTNATPKKNRIQKINELYNEGNTIIFNEEFYVLTENQLKRWGAKYHRLFLGKPAGDFYVDDKGINDYDFFTD